jgi:hypothetical protein
MRSFPFVGFLVVLLLVSAYHVVSGGQGRLRFISPQARIVTLGLGDRPVPVPVQVFIPRHADNRAFQITCAGACHWSYGPIALDGEEAGAIHPIVAARVMLDMPGTAELRVTVFDTAGKRRASAVHEIQVLGSGGPEVHVRH